MTSARPIVYRHRQTGAAMLVLLLVAAAIATAATIAAHVPAFAVFTLVLLAIALLLSTMTVEIDDRELRVYFGPGVTVKRVKLADIAAAEVAPSSIWNGWGIRLTGRGMVYNVGGTGAVEVTLKSGKRFRVGTDEEERLRAAIRMGAGLVE